MDIREFIFIEMIINGIGIIVFGTDILMNIREKCMNILKKEEL